MSITRDELKNFMIAINNEYENFLPNNIEQQRLKINTWYLALSKYSYKTVQSATIQLLCTFTYGTPKLAHMVEILEPKMENINEGIEFVTRLFDLSNKYGLDRKDVYVTENGVTKLNKVESGDLVADKLLDEFGKIGYSIYKQIKRELRVLTYNDMSTFKAQVRDLYNSYKEREKHDATWKLPYNESAQKLIDTDLKKIPISQMEITNGKIEK